MCVRGRPSRFSIIILYPLHVISRCCGTCNTIKKMMTGLRNVISGRIDGYRDGDFEQRGPTYRDICYGIFFSFLINFAFYYYFSLRKKY